MILLIAGLVWFLLGTAALRRLWFPIAFLLFAVPLPFVEPLSVPMAQFTGGIAAGVVSLFGMPITVNGAQVTLPNASLVVGAQCSGLRSIVTLLTLVALVVFLVEGSWQAKTLLALSSIPIAIIGNVLRIASLLVVGNAWGVDAAFTYYHDYSGIVFFLSAVGHVASLQLGTWMSRDQGRYLLVIVLLAAAVAGAFFLTQRQRLGASRAGGYEFVADVDNWQRTERERVVASPYNFNLSADLKQIPLTLGAWKGEDVPQSNVEVFILLEPEQYIQRLYQLPDGRYVWLSLIGSRKSKSFHSPQICYDTDGWRTDASSEPVRLGQGEVHALRLLAEKPVSGGKLDQVVLYFYLWPGTERAPQDGMVLVKVTAPVYDTVENTVALEADFLKQLFTAAR